MAEFQHRIGTPFAVNGLRREIPQTSEEDEVNYSDGFTEAYKTPPDYGGRYVALETINEIEYQNQSAIKEIQEKIDSDNEAFDTLLERFNTLADCDDETLDQLSEIVSYIKNDNTIIQGLTTGKVNVSDIVDALTSEETNKPLSANQGKTLKELLDALTLEVANKQEAGDYVTTTTLNNALDGKQDVGDYVTETRLNEAIANIDVSDIDLSGLVTTEEMNTALQGKQNAGNYVTTSELNNISIAPDYANMVNVTVANEGSFTPEKNGLLILDIEGAGKGLSVFYGSVAISTMYIIDTGNRVYSVHLAGGLTYTFELNCTVNSAKYATMKI